MVGKCTRLCAQAQIPCLASNHFWMDLQEVAESIVDNERLIDFYYPCFDIDNVFNTIPIYCLNNVAVHFKGISTCGSSKYIRT